MKKIALFLLIALPVMLMAQTGKPSAVRNLFDKKSIGEIRLTLPSKNWVDALDSLRLYGSGLMNAAVNVDGIRYEGSGVRFRGDNSYQKGLRRNPMSIKLNHTNSEQNHQGYTHLKLSSALRDPSVVREMLFSEIANRYIPAPQMSYTKLYINDEYLGIFVNVESVEKPFLEANYGGAKGSFFKAGVDYKPENLPANCRQGLYGALEYEDNLDCYKGNFEMNSAGGWSDIQELTRILNQEPAKIENVLDVDRTLWMLALNNVMVNLSSYSGNRSVNYYLYKDINGRFQPILWDLNLAFGSYKNIDSGSDLELKDLISLDPLLHANNPYKPLISKLLADPFYRKVYLSHIRQINEDNFLNGSYETRATQLQGMIVVPYSEDPNKAYNVSDFQRNLRETVGKKSKIPGISELMGKRSVFLKKHPELTALPSKISDLKVQSRSKLENKKINSFKLSAVADRFPKRMLVYYRFDSKGAYNVMTMGEESANDLPSGGKAFTVNIDAKSENDILEYYFIVENAGTVGFFPQLYTKEALRVKLSDLNK